MRNAKIWAAWIAVGVLGCGGKTTPKVVDYDPDGVGVGEETPDPTPVPPKEFFVAHEWGTFTSLAHASGKLQEWRPLDGSVELPAFVHQTPAPDGSTGRRDAKGSVVSVGGKGTTIRMETPVIYFHSSGERTVSVDVEFPEGEITEWFPAATVVAHRISWPVVTIVPGAAGTLQVGDTADNLYYAARATDAALVRVEAEDEKFLFYRGAGSFEVPLETRIDEANNIALLSEGISGLIIFERQGEAMGYRLIDAPADEMTLQRPALDDDQPTLEADLVGLLTGQGLTDQEALAMVATWRDFWFEDGLRVLYMVPRAVTDAIIPLTITPAPDEVVRVLVGRMEIQTPAQEQRIAGEVKKLGNSSKVVRAAAVAELRRMGRFARPVLERLYKSSGRGIQKQLDLLLG